MKPKKLALRPPTYQPKRSELRERHKIDATPEQVAQAVLRSVEILCEDDRGQGGPKR